MVDSVSMGLLLRHGPEMVDSVSKAWDRCYVTDRKWWTRLVRPGIVATSRTGNGGLG